MANKLQALLALVLFVIAVAVAIPTLSFQFRGKTYEIANVNPIDLTTGLITDYFEYKPALDLQGGYTVIFDVDLLDFSNNKLEQFKKTEEIIARRMALIGLRDFELTSFYNLEDGIFQLHLTTSEKIDDSIIQILSSPGRLDVLVDDPQADPENQENLTGSIFDGRTSAGITNSDILSVKVISDSRIYTSDPEQPNNFGLMVVVKPESEEKLQTALIANAGSNMPLIFTLDGSMVAIQASGYYLNPYDRNDRLMLYTLFDDTKLNNSVIAATMSTPNLEAQVTASEPIRLAPTLGDQALTNLKIASLAVFAIIHVALLFLLKKKALYVLAAMYCYLAVFIALQKVLNLNLSLAVISGSMAITFAFLMSQIVVITVSSKLQLSKKDLEEFVQKNSLSGWRAILSIAIAAPAVIFFENLLTVSANQFIQVVILGIIVWLIFKIIFFKVLFNLFAKITLK